MAIMKYWLQRDVHSPAEGPLPQAEILAMLKRRVIDPSAVVNEPGQPSWMRVQDVFARELRKWRWERFIVKCGIIGSVLLASAITMIVLRGNAERRELEAKAESERRIAYAQSPEGKAEEAREREARRKALAEYAKTPEGMEAKRRNEEAAKRSNEQAANMARLNTAVDRVTTFREASPTAYEMTAKDREDVMAVIVRLTNDADATLLDIQAETKAETLVCIAKFESRKAVRLWRILFHRLNGDLWSVADRETGKMIWSIADQ